MREEVVREVRKRQGSITRTTIETLLRTPNGRSTYLERDGETPVERRVDEGETEVEPMLQRAKSAWRMDASEVQTHQYAIAVPVAIIEASMTIRRPRLCEREHSAIQDGIVEVFWRDATRRSGRGSSLVTARNAPFRYRYQ